MSAPASLYGKLTADLAKDYRRQCDALRSNPDLINRFGEAIAPFNLSPTVKPSPEGGLHLSATSTRGDDAVQLLTGLKAAGFAVASIKQVTAVQFNDGFSIWTANVTGKKLEFSLLFYTRADAPFLPEFQ